MDTVPIATTAPLLPIISLPQKPNLKLGGMINNRGTVKNDKNPEIVTNKPYRTIDEAISFTVNPLTLAPFVPINACPNPLYTSSPVEVSGLKGHEPVTTSFYRSYGNGRVA